MERPGRNDACPCGSGRKYKRCCLPRLAELRRFDDVLEMTALPLLERLARYAQSVAEGGVEDVARREFPLWRGRVDKARAARVVDFLMFEFRPRHVGRRTIEQFAIETAPGLSPRSQELLSAWVDAPRRLVRTGAVSYNLVTCHDLLDDEAVGFEVADIDGVWRPKPDEPVALRPLRAGEFFVFAGPATGFGGRSAADVAESVRRRHFDFVRTQRIAGIGEFMALEPKALDEEAAIGPSSATILLPGH